MMQLLLRDEFFMSFFLMSPGSFILEEISLWKMADSFRGGLKALWFSQAPHKWHLLQAAFPGLHAWEERAPCVPGSYVG